MNERWTRRQMVFGFLARLLGLSTVTVAAAQAGSPEPSPPRCPHFVDGTWWQSSWPRPSNYRLADATGCPFCRGLAGPWGLLVATYTYDLSDPSELTRASNACSTFTYDPEKRCISVPGAQGSSGKTN